MIVGIGIDLTEVERFKLDEETMAWFAKRIFTEEEFSYALRKRPSQQHLAGAFAAKEALRKALGHAIPWRGAGVTHTEAGAPTFCFDEPTQEIITARGIKQIHLSITHSRESAAAVVILET